MRNIFFRPGDADRRLPVVRLPKPRRLPRVQQDPSDIVTNVACTAVALALVALVVLGYLA